MKQPKSKVTRVLLWIGSIMGGRQIGNRARQLDALRAMILPRR